MTEYTPGPWEAVYNEDEGGFDIWLTDQRGSYEPQHRIHMGDGMWDRYDDGPLPPPIQKQFDELLANARLIAAAPDLYEAAKELIDAITKQLAMTGKGITPSPRVAAALTETRAAIAKAEGVE